MGAPIGRPDRGPDGRFRRTFRDVARACGIQLRQWGYSEETITSYDRTYEQFLAYLTGAGRPDDLRSFDDATARGFAQDLGRRRLHPNTIILRLSALSTLARFAQMARDPTKSFRWPTAQRQETRYLAPDELARLLAVAAPAFKQHARDLLIETGLRVGEAARLNVEDLREVEGCCYLAVRRKGRGQQQRQETRHVPLSMALGAALRQWVVRRGRATEPGAPLLISSEGARWSRAALSTMIARLAAEAGLRMRRVSAHKLRHTANVIARLADIDPATRSRPLGHTSMRSMERYEHILPHELHEARTQQRAALERYIQAPRAAAVPADHEWGDL